jgi:hypothetical protein
MLIRLQVIALCPLVPGIQENDALIAPILVARIFENCLQPSLKRFRRRMVED